MKKRELSPIFYYFKHNKCSTLFAINGDFNPDIITEMLNVQPDRSWKIGDKRKNGTTYNFNQWIVGNVQIMMSIQKNKC